MDAQHKLSSRVRKREGVCAVNTSLCQTSHRRASTAIVMRTSHRHVGALTCIARQLGYPADIGPKWSPSSVECASEAQNGAIYFGKRCGEPT